MCTFSPPERYPLARDAPAPPRKRPSKAFSGAKSAWAGTSTSVVRVGVFLHLSGGRGPDGMAMDQSGGVAVAHVDFGAVWIFSHRGEALYRVQSCRTDMVTNVAYKGDELYITDSGSGCVLRAKVPTPGRPLYSHF